MMFLSETHLSVRDMEWVKNQLGFRHMFVVPSSGERGLSGGLAFLWQEEVNASLVSRSKYHIGLVIKIDAVDRTFQFTGFYGGPVVSQRQQGWDVLKILKNRSPLPWFCAANFNEILHHVEKWGGQPRNDQQMEAFQETIDFCALDDIGYKGLKFT